jgi:hypothetical protein
LQRATRRPSSLEFAATLADKLVELEIVEEELSYQTVRRTLKKTN